MPRPQKPRTICRMPDVNRFSPDEIRLANPVGMTLDEYETIRLIDYLDYSQEDCAAQMNVARTTVQSIYDSARKKLAAVLVEGRCMEIRGGTYTLCPQASNCCGGHCQKYRCGINRRNDTMIIAVTYENGQVFQHFGHCENFKIYQAEGKQIQSSRVVSAAGSGHGALAGFLKAQGVQVLICGGIGGGARSALAEAGIQLYPGVTGDADANVQAMLDGTLEYNPDTMCAHHHHGEGGTCGEHHCGENKHGCGGNHSSDF